MLDKNSDMLLFCNSDGSPVKDGISLLDLQYGLALGSILPVKSWMVTASIDWENELAHMGEVDIDEVVSAGKEIEGSWG